MNVAQAEVKCAAAVSTFAFKRWRNSLTSSGTAGFSRMILLLVVS